MNSISSRPFWFRYSLPAPAVLFMACLLGVPAGFGVAAQGAAATQPAQDGASLTRLLEELSHPQFKIREAATAALCGVSEQALPRLMQVYNAQLDHEPKLRLRFVIEHIFYRKQLEGRMGFLGVEPKVEWQVYDPKLGQAVDAILMRRVLSGFPAEIAGVQAGDMLLKFDGRSVGDIMNGGKPRPVVRQFNGGMRMMLPNAAEIEAFTNEVSRREPGSKVLLRLLRVTGDDRELAIKIAGEPGRTLEGARLLQVCMPPIAPTKDVVAQPVRLGLCLTEVTANSPAAAAGLKAGDVIVRVGNLQVSPDMVPEQLASLIKNARPGSTLSLGLSQVEEVQVTVELGGRPVDRMNSGDMEIAQARFAEYWREQTGESSLRNSARSLINQSVPRRATVLPDPTVLP